MNDYRKRGGGGGEREGGRMGRKKGGREEGREGGREGGRKGGRVGGGWEGEMRKKRRSILTAVMKGVSLTSVSDVGLNTLMITE